MQTHTWKLFCHFRLLHDCLCLMFLFGFFATVATKGLLLHRFRSFGHLFECFPSSPSPLMGCHVPDELLNWSVVSCKFVVSIFVLEYNWIFWFRVSAAFVFIHNFPVLEKFSLKMYKITWIPSKKHFSLTWFHLTPGTCQ